MAKNKIFLWIVVGIMAVSLVGLTGVFSLGPSSSSQNNQQPGSNEESSRGVPCLINENFHIHPHLQILVNGGDEPVPGNIGILPGCTREIHTHATDGIIHVEGPVDRGYTFADFLSVWGKSIFRDGYALKTTVDGQETSALDFVLKDGQQIVLEYTSNQ